MAGSDSHIPPSPCSPTVAQIACIISFSVRNTPRQHTRKKRSNIPVFGSLRELQVSSYWRAGEYVEIDLLPGVDFAAALTACRAGGTRTEVRTVLARYLPKRLADRWCQLQGISKAVILLSDREVAMIEAGLHAWCVQPAGTEGYEKAEVTGGGVDTGELSSKTMECRKVPGLYFIGEVADVTGQLGGFNFQWAWASGAAAGRAL